MDDCGQYEGLMPGLARKSLVVIIILLCGLALVLAGNTEWAAQRRLVMLLKDVGGGLMLVALVVMLNRLFRKWVRGRR
ncbi:MAG: hypothetical protein KF744_14145 [Taibaiella sp.]|nr:hypothetical protein [Taibaiella sp.]